MLDPVLPRVAVIAATLAFSRQILENRLNQSHRNLGPVIAGLHWHHPLSSIERGTPDRRKSVDYSAALRDQNTLRNIGLIGDAIICSTILCA